MATEDTTLLDLDSLENGTLDDVEAAPDFVEPPTGDYLLGISKAGIEEFLSKKAKEEGKEPVTRIRFIYTVKKVHQLADANELQPAEGSLFSENFQGTSEGLRYFKKRVQDILGGADKIKGATIKDICNELEAGGYEFNARVTLKVTKDKETGNEYRNVNLRVTKAAQAAELPA